MSELKPCPIVAAHISCCSECNQAWKQRQPHPDMNYKLFYESVSCLLVEGVEFMGVVEIYNAIKREHKKYKPESLQQAMEQEK